MVEERELPDRGAGVLVLRDLAIGYDAAGVVAGGIRASLEAGELACLIGPNGSGKSTLLRTLAGLQPPLGGSIRIGGRELSELKPGELARQLAVVLTDEVSVGHITAEELVALGRSPYTDWTGRLTARDREMVRWAIDEVGAGSLAGRSVDALSDGERQRLMIARALAQDPQVLILDEVTAFLDLPRRVDVMRILRRLARTTGKAVLLSTHELDLALRSADRVWLLAPNGVLQTGAPEDLVLRGDFAEVFRSEGVHFDTSRGVFQIHGSAATPIRLIGEGAARFWTAHALEREGFHAVESVVAGGLEVEALRQEDGIGWRSSLDGVSRKHATIGDLLRYLRRHREVVMEQVPAGGVVPAWHLPGQDGP
jgi:iron complex transport system ATP-binding protein